MTDAGRFPIQVFYNEDDEGYIAIAPDIPGSSAFGSTHEEAVREVKTVIALALKAIQAAGNPLPTPSAPPQEEFSGKVLLRIPKSLHAKLAKGAKDDGVSLNTYMNVLLAEHHLRNERIPTPEEAYDLHSYQVMFDNLCLTRLVKATSTKITKHGSWKAAVTELPGLHQKLDAMEWTAFPANKPVIQK